MTGKEWDFGDFFSAGFGPRGWAFSSSGRHGGSRRRQQIFESGDMKYVILRLIREKPRHGYEVIKALEERMHGCYTPSAGTVYPTLQLLEDQDLVRAVDENGKKVYHITPEGEKFLDENQTTVDDILDRVKEAVRGFAGGAMGDVNNAFGQLARLTFSKAWRSGPDDDKTRKIVEILKRAVTEIEAV
jgi:DNA-binding PadR family transcriptional regulator